MDRLSFAQKLLEAGASQREANRALVYAVQTFPSDVPLIITLAANADSTDGEALMHSIRKQNSDVVELLLVKAPRRYDQEVINKAFLEAVSGTDRGQEACYLRRIAQGRCGRYRSVGCFARGISRWRLELRGHSAGEWCKS